MSMSGYSGLAEGGVVLVYLYFFVLTLHWVDGLTLTGTETATETACIPPQITIRISSATITP